MKVGLYTINVSIYSIKNRSFLCCVHDTHIKKMYIKFFLKGVMTKKWDKNHRNKTIFWSSVNNASQPCLDIRIPLEALKKYTNS